MRSFLHYVTCPVSCPVASSLVLALPAVLQQQQQLVTSPHAAYHPRASSCYVSSRLQHFHCPASQLQGQQHTHSDSRAATFFSDRKRNAVPTRPLARTIVQNNTLKQASCCYRSSGEDAGRSSIDAIETKPCKQKPNTHARTPNCY